MDRFPDTDELLLVLGIGLLVFGLVTVYAWWSSRPRRPRRDRRWFLVLIVPSLLLNGCGKEDHSRDQWLQHKPTSWTTTPGGHVRDAGPFGSVAAGFTTDAEIDQAVDAAYAHYANLFPEYPVYDHPITINDDYVIWVPGAGWAAGVQYSGSSYIGVTLWTRGTTTTEPADGSVWIKRAPGNSFGTVYDYWRYTSLALVPAVEHELLHTVIGDAGHTSPLWSRLNGSARKAEAAAAVDCLTVQP